MTVGSVKISIITVAKNSAATIAAAIESVNRQTHPAEHILIDGSSADETLAIMRKHASPHAKILSEPDKSLYDAMNKGLAMASGDVAAILNSDDYYASDNVLSQVAEQFEKNEIDSCYGDIVYVHPENTSKVIRYWRSGPYDRNRFYQGWMPPHSAFFVKRSLYEKLGGFDLSMGLSADYELMLRFLFKHEITTTYIPEILAVMRAGGKGNVTLGARWKANRLDKLAWKVNGLKPKPWTIVAKPLFKLGQYLTFKKIENSLP